MTLEELRERKNYLNGYNDAIAKTKFFPFKTLNKMKALIKTDDTNMLEVISNVQATNSIYDRLLQLGYIIALGENKQYWTFTAILQLVTKEYNTGDI